VVLDPEVNRGNANYQHLSSLLRRPPHNVFTKFNSKAQ
jgi:hypothetical protein